jgi:hypothetical protein
MEQIKTESQCRSQILLPPVNFEVLHAANHQTPQTTGAPGVGRLGLR